MPSRGQENFEVEEFSFLNVEEFTYLGSQLNTSNIVLNEIKMRILSGNRCYYAYKNPMKSKALNRNLKLKIYKTIIRPVVTYGYETWNLTCKDELMLGIFERKILRRIFGPVRNNYGSYRILINHELDNCIKGATQNS